MKKDQLVGKDINQCPLILSPGIALQHPRWKVKTMDSCIILSPVFKSPKQYLADYMSEKRGIEIFDNCSVSTNKEEKSACSKEKTYIYIKWVENMPVWTDSVFIFELPIENTRFIF